MITGTDIVIPCAEKSVALDLAVRAIKLQWPDVHIENAKNGLSFTQYSQIDFGRVSELLCFKSKAASQAWDKLGPCLITDGTLIHLLATATELTIVVDTKISAEIQTIIEEIRCGINRISPPAKAIEASNEMTVDPYELKRACETARTKGVVLAKFKMTEEPKTKEDTSELTEKQAVQALRKLAARWPKNLWLFSASGTLTVMRSNPDGTRKMTDIGGVDPSAAVTTISGIPNDGGDW